jgi:hypothetical protein
MSISAPAIIAIKAGSNIICFSLATLRYIILRRRGEQSLQQNLCHAFTFLACFVDNVLSTVPGVWVTTREIQLAKKFGRSRANEMLDEPLHLKVNPFQLASEEYSVDSSDRSSCLLRIWDIT